MSEVLKAKLRRAAEKQEGARVVDKEGEEELFRREYLAMGGGVRGGKDGGSFSVIPQFYKPLLLLAEQVCGMEEGRNIDSMLQSLIVRESVPLIVGERFCSFIMGYINIWIR